MSVRPDIACFRIDSARLRDTEDQCYIGWDIERGLWRAWDDGGYQAFSCDREHAALKLFAIKRRASRKPCHEEGMETSSSFNWPMIPAMLAAAAVIAACVDGVVHIATTIL